MYSDAKKSNYSWLAALHLAILSIVGAAGQQLYGNQVNSGIRESLLAINAYCDVTCAPYMSQTQISQCFQNAIAQNEAIVQILRSCTLNSRYLIYCNPNVMVQLENCALQYAFSYYMVVNAVTKRCFRDSLSVGTIDCLRMRYPRLNRLLPLGPPNS